MHRVRRRFAHAALGFALVATACSGGAEIVSDTGFVGTWGRGNDRAKTRFSIAEVDDGYRFHWRADSADGTWKVRCDWKGVCFEYFDEMKTTEFRFRIWEGDDGIVRVECRGRYLESGRETHYIDELVLADEGRTLEAWTVERDGQTFEGDRRPLRRYAKIADAIPPGSGSGPS